jgi:hypothetical protein
LGRAIEKIAFPTLFPVFLYVLPFDRVIEISNVGFSSRMLQVTSIYDWPMIKGMEETADAIYFPGSC